MLKELKTFSASNADVEEMIELSAFGRSISAEYAALGIEAPKWIEEKQTEVRRELNARLADAREKRKREIRAALTTLRTAEEKRADLAKELAQLEAVQ